MPEIQHVQYDFTRGQIPQLALRPDVQMYYQGCTEMHNMHPQIFGGAASRKGYAYMQTMDIAVTANMVEVAFRDSQQKDWLIYLVGGKAYVIDIGNPTVVSAIVTLPYSDGEVPFLSTVQRGDVLIIAHGNHAPAQLSYNGSAWSFSPLPLTNPPQEGGAAVWTSAKGYPRYVSLWRGRMWFLGSTSYPQHYWASRTYNYYDFERKTDDTDNSKGTLLDDAAIFGSVTGEGSPEFSNVYADNALFMVTTRGVFAYTSKVAPTPLNFNPIAYAPEVITRRGSPRPVKLDGRLVFVAGDPTPRMQSLVFDADFDQAKVEDISVLSPELIKNPRALATRFGQPDQPSANRLYVVNDDGTLAVFLTVQEQSIAAWSGESSVGKVHSVVVVAQKLFVLMELGDKLLLVRGDAMAGLDFQTDETASAAKSLWVAPAHLAGQAGLVAIGGNGGKTEFNADKTQATITPATDTMTWGLEYSWRLESLPIGVEQGGVSLAGRRKGVAKISFYVEGTRLQIDQQSIELAQKMGRYALGDNDQQLYRGWRDIQTTGFSAKDEQLRTVNFAGSGREPCKIVQVVAQLEVGR